MRKLLLAICLTLTGCDDATRALEYVFFGFESTSAVIASTPIDVGPQATRYVLDPPMEIVGDTFSICLALKEDVPLMSSDADSRLLSELTHNAKVTIEARLSNGDALTQNRLLTAWSLSGTILNHKEFSGCANYCLSCTEDNAVALEEFSIASDIPFRAQGIYANSDNFFDE